MVQPYHKVRLEKKIQNCSSFIYFSKKLSRLLLHIVLLDSKGSISPCTCYLLFEKSLDQCSCEIFATLAELSYFILVFMIKFKFKKKNRPIVFENNQTKRFISLVLLQKI